MARLPYKIPYDPNFLGEGFSVPLPKTCCKGTLLNKGEVFDYIHFSLVMHKDRRMALYTGHNIDFGQKQFAKRTSWDLDPRIDPSDQVGNEAYKNNDWDRGHLVRRDAVTWGTPMEAQDASDSTFYYPVANLQHKDYNQSNSKWLGLENWILQKAGAYANRLCVFTGPIYTDIDEEERGIKIPAAFFKVVVLRDPTAEGQDLSALGFIMKQNEKWRTVGSGRRALENLQPYHVSIAEIEAYTGLDFGQIADLDEFDWRQVRFRNRAISPPIPVKGPDEIIFSGNRRRARGIRAIRTFRSSQELHITEGLLDRTRSFRKESEIDCGCNDQEYLDMKAEIKALKSQTTALCEIIESMIENDRAEGRNRSGEFENAIRYLLPRIIGGSIVAPGEYPECVAVGNESGFFCTGVLVHRSFVLTAAHCVVEPITRVFLKGRQLSDPTSGEFINVKEVYQHPDYNSSQVPWHDIAVLELEKPSTAEPVEIATKNEIHADDSLVLVGFGSDSPDGLTGFGTKRKVNVGLTVTQGLNNNEIQEKQFELGFDINNEFHGGDFRLGKDTCNGDSGGPAYIITSEGKLKVAGLTSRAAANFDDNCGDGGIYTIIAAYSIWLKNISRGSIVLNPEEENENFSSDTLVSSNGLYISAALPNPAGPDSGTEWVEVTNNSAQSFILDHLWIADKQGGRLPLSGSLGAGKTSRIIIPKDNPIRLSNNGDEIVLNSSEEIIHKVSYPNAGSGQIIIFQSPYNETNPGDGSGSNPDCCNNHSGDDSSSDCSQSPIDIEFTPGALRC